MFFINNRLHRLHCFFSRKDAKERQGFFINNAISRETRYTLQLHFSHDGHSQLCTMAYGWTHDVSSLWKLILYRASKLSHWDRGTRNEVTEGVDKNWQERGQSTNNGLSTPSPLRGTPPVSGGELASAMELKHDVDGWLAVTERVYVPFCVVWNYDTVPNRG